MSTAEDLTLQSQAEGGADNTSQYILHPLKDRWFVNYIPAVKDSQEYDDACIDLDYVSTIEEVFAVLNTFPHPTLLPVDDNLVFARNKIEPKFESFPGGHRVVFFTKIKMQCDEVVMRVLAAVLGEEITQASKGDSIADMVRIAHKPSHIYNDSVRIEVWLHKSDYADAVLSYFRDLLKTIPGVQMNLRSM